MIDATSGMSPASNSPDINPGMAARNTAVAKQTQKAVAALKLQGETIEDMLISLTDQLYLLKPSTSGNKPICLLVSMRSTNLAIAREVLRANAKRLD